MQSFLRSLIHVLVLGGGLLLGAGRTEAARVQDEAPPAGGRSAPTQEDRIVREVHVEGLESYSEAGVLRALGIEVGKPLPLLRPGVKRVWDTYRLLVFPRDPVVLPEGGLRLTIRVQELPVDLDPRFVGNDDIDEKTLREWAMLFDREEVYLHEADGIRNRLVQGYQRHGYLFAEVDVVVGGAEAGAPNDVIFQIREGPKVRTTAVLVHGNEHLPDTGWGFWRGGLKALAKTKTKGRGLFRWWGGVYDREVLEADLLAMRQVYRDRGWLDAKVAIERLELNDKRNRLRVHVIVDEGPLWRVSSVRLVAVDPESLTGAGPERTEELLFPEAELRELLNLREGVPFEAARRQNDQREVTGYYGERGHLPAELFQVEGTARERGAAGFRWLEPDLIYDVESHQVAVTYRIVQGTRRILREVRFEGNAHTNDRVLRRLVSELPGHVVNMREIERSRSRIVSTGYFIDQQDPTHPPPRVYFREVEGHPELVDVEFIVAEGRVVDFQLSGGVNSDRGPVGLISLSMRNFQAGDTPSGFWSMFGEVYRKEAFHGNGESFDITFSPGTQVNQWSTSYSHPDIFGTHFDRYSGQVEVSGRDRRYLSHDEGRTRAGVSLARLFAQGDFSVRLGARWMEVDLSDLDEDSDLPQTLIDSEGSSTFQGLTLDLRYNRLDNRISPSKGFYGEWNNTLYGGPFGGDNDLWTSEVGLERYWQLGSEEDDVHSGIFLGLGAAVAQPYGDTDFANYAERFFLGGSVRMRGFDFRGVGPNEGDFPVGGETMAFGTLEYRRPIYTTPVAGTSRRQEVFRGSLFVDVGILDPDPFRIDPDELRASAGVSFGLVQPIPLTFSFGFPLRKGEGDDLEVFSFRIMVR